MAQGSQRTRPEEFVFEFHPFHFKFGTLYVCPMKGLSFDVLRVGKKYKLINYGEVNEFVVEYILANGDFKVKNIHTLERYLLKDLIKYGKGNDLEIREIE